MADIRALLQRYFNLLFIDKVQVFAGHDFNFLLELCSAGIAGRRLLHIFDTSRDGNINATLHDNITRYESRFKEAGILPGREPSAKRGAAH